jgi:hypothetical protein
VCRRKSIKYYIISQVLPILVPERPWVSPLGPAHGHNGCQNQQYLDCPLFNGKGRGTIRRIIRRTNENVVKLPNSNWNIFSL